MAVAVARGLGSASLPLRLVTNGGRVAQAGVSGATLHAVAVEEACGCLR